MVYTITGEKNVTDFFEIGYLETNPGDAIMKWVDGNMEDDWWLQVNMKLVKAGTDDSAAIDNICFQFYDIDGPGLWQNNKFSDAVYYKNDVVVDRVAFDENTRLISDDTIEPGWTAVYTAGRTADAVSTALLPDQPPYTVQFEFTTFTELDFRWGVLHQGDSAGLYPRHMTMTGLNRYDLNPQGPPPDETNERCIVTEDGKEYFIVAVANQTSANTTSNFHFQCVPECTTPAPTEAPTEGSIPPTTGAPTDVCFPYYTALSLESENFQGASVS